MFPIVVNAGARIPHDGDPLFGLSYLRLNGTSTLTKDDSSFNRVLTGIGSEALNSDVTLFGNPTYASPANAAGSYLDIASSSWAGDFGNAEFCVRGWHYPLQDTLDYDLFRIGIFKGERLSSVGKVALNCSNINSTSYSLDTGAGSFPSNQWGYFAFVRDNSIAGPSDYLRLYFGVLGGTATQVGFFTFTKGVGVGASGGLKEAQGYSGNRNAGRYGPFDFTIGASVYPAGTSFLVPTAPFPAR